MPDFPQRAPCAFPLPPSDQWCSRAGLRIAGVFALGALAASSAQAALTWETTRADADALFSQENYSTRFSFKNTGTTAVTITELQTSCGCTTAELTKRTYAPGETGAIPVVFTFGDRSGPQQKVVTVRTDDAPAQPTALILRVNIPVAVTLERTLLSWTAGGAEPLPAQSVGIAVNPAAGVKLLGVRSNLASVTARLVTTPGAESKLVVTPSAEAKPGSAVILIDTERAGQAKAYTVYVLIR